MLSVHLIVLGHKYLVGRNLSPLNHGNPYAHQRNGLATLRGLCVALDLIFCTPVFGMLKICRAAQNVSTQFLTDGGQGFEVADAEALFGKTQAPGDLTAGFAGEAAAENFTLAAGQTVHDLV